MARSSPFLYTQRLRMQALYHSKSFSNGTSSHTGFLRACIITVKNYEVKFMEGFSNKVYLSLNMPEESAPISDQSRIQ